MQGALEMRGVGCDPSDGFCVCSIDCKVWNYDKLEVRGGTQGLNGLCLVNVLDFGFGANGGSHLVPGFEEEKSFESNVAGSSRDENDLVRHDV